MSPQISCRHIGKIHKQHTKTNLTPHPLKKTYFLKDITIQTCAIHHTCTHTNEISCYPKCTDTQSHSHSCRLSLESDESLFTCTRYSDFCPPVHQWQSSSEVKPPHFPPPLCCSALERVHTLLQLNVKLKPSPPPQKSSQITQTSGIQDFLGFTADRKMQHNMAKPA